MNNPIVTLDTFSVEMENVMRQHCAARGVEYDELRRTFFGKMLSDSRPEVLGRELLDAAFACKERGDQAGYRAACLDWLAAAHDLHIGDTVRLFSGRYTRDVKIEDARLSISQHNLKLSHIWIVGDCVSPQSEKSREYMVGFDDAVEKLS